MSQTEHHDPFEEMEKAVDIVNDSLHSHSKVAATIYGKTTNGEPFSLSSVNYWPDEIYRRIGPETRIGDSSGTVHAETACLLKAPYTKDAAICVTDLFCPNCAKNMAEAGIQKIYIDHKGFEKDFAQRRGTHFQNMSLRICEQAGIEVYKINRKEKTIENIFIPPADFSPEEDSPVDLSKCEPEDFIDFVKSKKETQFNRRFAIGLGRNVDGKIFALTARSHPSIGFTHYKNKGEIYNTDGKYSFILEPINRVLMNASRFGLTLIERGIYSSRVPTSREQVDLAGADVKEIYLGNNARARDEQALHAMKLLEFHDILIYTPVE